MSSVFKHLKCAGCDISLKKVTGRKKMVEIEEEANCFSSSLDKNNRC